MAKQQKRASGGGGGKSTGRGGSRSTTGSASRSRAGTSRRTNKAGLHPESDAKPGPPDAAVTNRDHPAPVGAAPATVPGAGIVRPGADAGPRQGGGEGDADRDYPGRDAPDARASAPGAERPGTTDTGPGATPARGAVGGLDEREISGTSGQAPLSVPTGGTGAPSPGPSGDRATSDPNYPARRRGDRDRSNA